MSSSESSEDDEELKKINQAVIPDDLLFSLTPAPVSSSSSILTTETETVPENEKEGSRGSETIISNGAAVKKADSTCGKLPKSKRPDKNKEQDEGSHHVYFLKTTPQFKAHVEKHLTQVLDRQIEASLRDSVWKKPDIRKQQKQKGIKLFSDVKTLCLGEEDTNQDVIIARRSPPIIRPRKHKLNASSSESSDDEDKINACIFTVDNISHENLMLSNLSKSGLDNPITTKESKHKDAESYESGVNDISPKKKKKKKKDASLTLRETDDDCDETANSVCKKKNKKKKKKTSEINDVAS